MYEYKCEWCGAIRTVRFKREIHRCCSRSCALKVRHSTHPRKKVKEPKIVNEDYDHSIEWERGGSWLWNCPYAENVGCNRRTCTSCGWNPEVAKERSRLILQARGVL